MYSIRIFYCTFYLLGGVRTHPTHPPAYGAVNNISTCPSVQVLTMLVAYGRIAYTLWFHSRPGEPTATGLQLDSVGAVSKRLGERKRVVRMLVVIVSVFAVSWFPFFSLQVYDPAPHGAERSTALGVSVCVWLRPFVRPWTKRQR